jgi:hypothetical protein
MGEAHQRESLSISNRHSATPTIGGGIECQPKVAGRIDEGGNGVKRHRHASSDPPEKQVDFKAVVAHDQMLELVPYVLVTALSQSHSNAIVVSGRGGSVQRLAISMQALGGSFGGDAALPFASHPPPE